MPIYKLNAIVEPEPGRFFIPWFESTDILNFDGDKEVVKWHKWFEFAKWAFANSDSASLAYAFDEEQMEKIVEAFNRSTPSDWEELIASAGLEDTTPENFVTTSGKKVHFEALHIEISTLGFLEGGPLIRREIILKRLSQTIRGKFGYTGLLLREPPAGPLPKYAFFASFHCYEPIKPGSDCSSLTIVWFADSLPVDLSKELRTQFQDVNWERHAKDGSV